MSDTSSVFKICPHCGQSVSVAAKFCPACGTVFSEESSDCVAYERFSNPAPSQNGSGRQDDPSFRPVQSPSAVRTMAEAASDYDDDYDAPPPMGGKHEDDDDPKHSGIIVTAVAAVLLIAVVAVGVIMAFRMGILGQTKADPMALAQEAYDEQNYEEAIAQLEQMLQEGSGTPETYDLMARSFEESGNLQGAAETWLKGYTSTQDSGLKRSAIDAYLKLGDQAKEDGNTDTAREYYNTVLERLDTNNSTAIASLGALQATVSASPSPAPSAAASPAPGISGVTPPSPTSGQAQPSGSPVPGGNNGNEGNGGNGGNAAVFDDTPVSEGEEAIATPTPIPSPTPEPTPTPTPEPTPTPTPEPTPTPTPEPTPTPTPEPNPTFELDGHKYELVISDASWWSCHDAAASAGGHLLTINSGDEFSKCASVAAENGVVFLRLNAIRGDWEYNEWNNGESFSYTAWLDGEPSGGDEEYLCMFNVGGSWYYNDTTDSVSEYSGRQGYIIEYE